MEYKINLIRQSRQFSKKGRIIWSIIILLFIGTQAWYIVRYPDQNIFLPVTWIFWGLTMLYSVLTGKPLMYMFGKAYIFLSNEGVRVKPTPFAKEQSLLWEEIGQVDLKPTYIRFTGKDGKEIRISFKDLTFQEVQEIRDLILTRIPAAAGR